MASDSTLEWGAGRVSVVWDHPPGGQTYLLLGHGAGGDLHTPGLALYAGALAAAGIGAVRFNFPYVEARRKIPDKQPVLELCFRRVAEQVQGRAERLYLGGRSMGGRIASYVAAEGFPALGLVFLSYPLHPPGRPERLRSAHLMKIRVPMLFLHGTRDAFAGPALLREVLDALPTVTLHDIQGADHGLAVRGRAPEDVTRELVEVTRQWLGDQGSAAKRK